MSARAIVAANPVAAKAPVQRHAPTSLLQRKCDCGGPAGMEGECEECKKKKLQRRATGTGPAVAPAIVHDVLRSAGEPLDQQTRSFFEPRFGHDFSRVRVHTDSRAAQSAKSVHALAYTTGENLVFAAGQYAPDTQAGRRLLAHELTHVVQQGQAGTKAVQRKLEVGPAHDALEQEAERFAEQITSDRSVSAASPLPPPSQGSGRKVQRAAAAGEGDAQAAAAAAPAPGDLIVEDEAGAIGPGQMRKTEFLDKLRDSTCAAADAVLSSMGRTAQGCPFIERWIARLRTRTSKHIERAIRKYAPESASASAAQDYLAVVSQRVSRGVARWASTGDIAGIPPELIGEMAGGGILGGIASAISSVAGSIGGAASSIGKLFAKARDGGVRDVDPVAVRSRLGAGKTLDMGIRSRMESVFGHSFSSVRIHADSAAAQLSSAMNARAFTIGSDIAFAAGEYQPGTLIGDALVAHELAHVMQQGGGSARPVSQNSAEYKSLEQDADISAAGAMFSLWGGAKGMAKDARANVLPQLRSGLRLQRCGGEPTPAARSIKPEPTNIRWDPNANCAGLEPQIGSLLGEAVARVRIAHDALDTPASVAGPLMKNFRMSPDDPGVATVRQVLQGVIEGMEATAQGKSQTASMGTAPAILCTPCRGESGDGTDTCRKSTGRVDVGLCVSGAQLVSLNPVRTVVHEFVHATCGRTKEVVANPGFIATGSTGVNIIAGDEKERELQTVQPEVAKNLESPYAYAQFVMDASGS